MCSDFAAREKLKDMEGTMRVPPALSFEGNVKENWKKWRQRFEVYLVATDLKSKSDERKIAVLLHVAGEEAMEKYETFGLSDEQKKSLDEVYKAFEEFCTPKVNESVERHFFFSRVQNGGENFTSFVTDLKKLSASCEFGTLKDSLIKDRIICGIRDNELKNKLLREENLTLEKCVNICKAAELAEIQIKTMDNENKVKEIKSSNKKNNHNKNKFKGDAKKFNHQDKKDDKFEHAGQPSNSSGKSQRAQRGDVMHQQRFTCTRCGRQHAPRQCPAYGKLCNYCKGRNHFANVCNKKNANNVNTIENSDLDSLYVSFVDNEQVKNENIKEWYEMILVNKKFELQVKLDSGAQCNVILFNELKKIDNKIKLDKCSTKLSAYGGSKIEVMGTCKLNCKFINRDETLLEFIVAKGENKCHPTIIGLPTLLKLQLIKRIETIVELNEKSILNEYKNIFNGTGIISNFEYDMKLKENAKGSIASCRKVPVALIESLKSELNKMEKCGIIERVNEPSEWVNPLVITQKKDGKIRICLDPTELNKNILRQHHVIPSFDELCARMPNAKIFSTLDADRGFWQIKLSEKSSKYVTFITPFGRFKFNVMPFGISSATEIFQSCFDEIFCDLEGVIILVDDILVWGSTPQENDGRLKKVLERAYERNVRFNLNKCQFKKSKVKYIGHVFTDKGIKVDNDRIKAIVEMDKPNNKDELLTFLGMIAYVGRFVPNLSEVSSTLRNLTKKDSVWLWDANADKAFLDLKNLLINSPTLKYFDVNKPVVLSVDASQHGLGAVILQDSLPVAYASRALTNTEIRYAQIEKEALAIVFACNKFHQYIFGKKVLVESDHKPLEPLFKRPIDQCPARIQRMRLATQKYDIEVKYKPGKELLLADALSRKFLKNEKENFDFEIEQHVHTLINNFPISIEKKELFQKETENDDEMQTLIKYINEGWPKDKKNICGIVKPYYGIANELSIIDGLIFKSDKLVVPKNLRSEMLNLIHYNHFGIEKCKARAREILYWPFMSKEIADMVSNCYVCCKYKKAKVKEPLMPREVPHEPWQMVGLDLFQYKGSDHLLVIDYFSKYAEVSKLKSTDASSVIDITKNIFARFGIPETVCSDNGPQFYNFKMKQFSKDWNFKHDTSSPYWPQSNGMVERYVQTIKDMFKKVEEDGKDPYLALMEYRNTPIDENIMSPNDIMFNRKVRGIVPVRNINKKKLIIMI